MPSGYYSGVFGGLILIAFRLVIGAVMLRFLLHWVRADFRFNPLARGLMNITNPVLIPLRRFVPGFKGVDWAAVVLMVVLALIARGVLLALSGFLPSLPGLLVLAVAELLIVAYYLFLYSIFLIVIASWIAPGGYNPALELVSSLAEPLLRPMRQILPPLGGLDLSPVLAGVLLYLTRSLLIVPLEAFGYSLMM
jgi:YggT family protein